MGNWHYLDFSRVGLRKEGGTWVEQGNHTQDIGPGSWADLWHLSQGDVIIGHMASHFTRVAWHLAMGRRGHFVPYISVDGRSPCCDITEICAHHGPTSMDSC